MRKSFGLILIVMAMLAVSVALSAQDKKVSAAVKAAESWLGTVDAGNYVGSWDEAAGMFKLAITREKWSEALQQARKPLGRESARKLLGAEHKDSIPGAPAGEYVIMQFNTNFENKVGAVETVTMALEKDGTWRAAGYFIR